MNGLPTIFGFTRLLLQGFNIPCFSRFISFWNVLPLLMPKLDPLNELMYQREVLRAEQEIRDQHLNTFIREVYENIGQVLSLANMELGMLQEENNTISKQRVNRIGELVRKAIGDLRHMGGKLYPELNGFKMDELVEILNEEIKVQKLAASEFNITLIGKQQPISPGNGLILFRILKDLLTEISKKGILLSASAISQEDNLTFDIQFKGNWPDQLIETKEDYENRLSIKKKIELIGGELAMKEIVPADLKRQITIHLKNCSNG